MLPQLDFATYPSQLFWLMISFVLVYLVVSKIFMPAMNIQLAYRRKVVDTLVQETIRLQSEAKTLDEEAQKLIVEAYNLSSQLHSKALEELDQYNKQQQVELTNALGKIEAEANKELLQILESLEQNANAAAVQHANAIIQQFTKCAIDLQQMQQLARSMNESRHG